MLYVSAFVVVDVFDGSVLVGCSGISVVEERLRTCGLEARGGIEFALAVGDRFFTGEPLGLESEELRFSNITLFVVTGDLYATCWTACGDAYSLALSLGLKLDRTVPPGETTDSSFVGCAMGPLLIDANISGQLSFMVTVTMEFIRPNSA